MEKPNATLERYFYTGKKAFGKPLSAEERENVRKELLFRAYHGIYIFRSRSERKRLRPVAPVISLGAAY